MVLEFNSISKKDNEQMGFWVQRKFETFIGLSKQIIKQIDYPKKEILLNNFKLFDLIYYEEVAKQREKEEGICWEMSITSEEVIDYFYGIDIVINYRGYVYAIDVTSNEDKIQKKLSGKNIKAIKKALDIDFVCICYWNIDSQKMFTQNEFANLIFNFKTQLKQIKDSKTNKISLINL